MKQFIIRVALVAAICSMSVLTSFAQEESKVEKAVSEFVKKYEGTDGITSMSVAKGSGLELIKLMLNKEFGKSFMKGVKSITIIDYSAASEVTCAAVRKDLDVFLSMLQEFNLNGEIQFSDNDFIRCFANEDSGTLSDFVIALENGKSKTVMYMAGKIIVEE